MPLTLAHPAAVLPLVRWFRPWVVPSALVIGSMGPDFVYYLPLPYSRTDSHSIVALLWFVLPLGLLFYGIYHALLRPPLEELLPPEVRARLASGQRSETAWDLRRLPQVAVSLVAGGATHLLWDSFTHGNGWFVEHVGWLSTHLETVGHYQIRGYKILQHGGTLLGLSCLFWWARRWYRRTPAVPLPPEAPGVARRRWLVAAAVPTAGVVAGLRAGLAAPDGQGWLENLQHFAGPFAVTGTSAVVASLLAYSGLWIAVRIGRGS